MTLIRGHERFSNTVACSNMKNRKILNELVDLAKEISWREAESAHWFLLVADDKI